MYRAYKIEIKPNLEQIQKIEQTSGVCRYIYNLFIDTNRTNYQNGGKYLSGYDFSKWLNNYWRQKNQDKSWVFEVSSKAVKQSIMNADTAYRKFLSGKKGFPNFKKRNSNIFSEK